MAEGNAATLNQGVGPPYYRRGNERVGGALEYSGPAGCDPAYTTFNTGARGCLGPGDLWIRYYAPDRPAGVLGGVPLPRVLYQLPDGRRFYIQADISAWAARANEPARVASGPPQHPDPTLLGPSVGWYKELGIPRIFAEGYAHSFLASSGGDRSPLVSVAKGLVRAYPPHHRRRRPPRPRAGAVLVDHRLLERHSAQRPGRGERHARRPGLVGDGRADHHRRSPSLHARVLPPGGPARERDGRQRRDLDRLGPGADRGVHDPVDERRARVVVLPGPRPGPSGLELRLGLAQLRPGPARPQHEPDGLPRRVPTRPALHAGRCVRRARQPRPRPRRSADLARSHRAGAGPPLGPGPSRCP